MDPLSSIGRIAASGMHAQGRRLQVVAENVANAESTGATPGSDPFRRKTIAFAERVDRATGASMVEVDRIGRDRSDFDLRHDPAHPAADADGYVKMPNVSAILEMSDMREAVRSYEANLGVYESARGMRRRLVDLLR
ncbi:flagellar basal body rod protein FlgC [Jannaschia sp. Os4]|uniref:flagellar basal body rod protein FlgC n=1 Tax=Jannaschia sp. Os4 TaxID=2807617 RepID=UPI0019393C10|nr:flagellar basal body rod protein FlgC [Jannaschia sp. Os4]MBM2575657.1 flagellar basal body rod protein FlgC [Jannaschia sp. Os4]